MLKSSGALGLATLTSRLLGMVREMVYARFMGDGWVAGAFILAFQIPNLLRRLLGEGALTAAFVPVFKEKAVNGTPEEMWRAANAVISGLVAAAAAIIVLVVLGATLAVKLVPMQPETRLMLDLLRVMFPYLLPVCVAAVFIGMLNARGHFFVPAMGAVMLNIVMIASVLFLAPRMGAELQAQIFGLAIGVLLAGLAQAAFQWPSLKKEGFRLHWINPWGNETVNRVVRQMIPGMIGVAAFQINVLVTQSISFGLDPSIVASFNYAVRLMEFPQGVIGISFATYLLPTLSGLAAEKKFAEFRGHVASGLSYVFFINLLAAVLLLVLAVPMVRLIFERGEFGPLATQRTAFALACLAPSLVAYSLVNILARAFYALGDTKTPMRISIFCLLLNIVLVTVLVFPFAQGGLGMANTLSATLNAGLLVYSLRRKLKTLDLRVCEQPLLALFILALLAGAAGWGAAYGCEYWFGHATLLPKILGLFGPMALAALVYFGLAAALKLGPACDVLAMVRKILKRKC